MPRGAPVNIWVLEIEPRSAGCRQTPSPAPAPSRCFLLYSCSKGLPAELLPLLATHWAPLMSFCGLDPWPAFPFAAPLPSAAPDGCEADCSPLEAPASCSGRLLPPLVYAFRQRVPFSKLPARGQDAEESGLVSGGARRQPCVQSRVESGPPLPALCFAAAVPAGSIGHTHVPIAGETVLRTCHDP